jgi:hypothetical protein
MACDAVQVAELRSAHARVIRSSSIMIGWEGGCSYDVLTDSMRLVQQWAERTCMEVESWADLAPDGKRDGAMTLFE